jgi:hypothetical protein
MLVQMLVVPVIIQAATVKLMVSLIQLVVTIKMNVITNVNGNGIPEMELLVEIRLIQTGEKFLAVLAIVNATV